MSSVSNLLGRDKAPDTVAVTSAVKADLARMAAMFAPKREGEWPGLTVGNARRRLAISTAQDLLADFVDEKTLNVIKEALACEQVQAATVYGVEHDFGGVIDNLEQATAELSDYTFEVCRQHVGEVE